MFWFLCMSFLAKNLEILYFLPPCLHLNQKASSVLAIQANTCLLIFKIILNYFNLFQRKCKHNVSVPSCCHLLVLRIFKAFYKSYILRIHLLPNSYRTAHLLLLKISSQDLAAVLGSSPNSLRKTKGT